MNMLVNGVSVDFTAGQDDLCLICELILHQTEILHAQLHITACSKRMIALFLEIQDTCPNLAPSITRIYV